MLNSTVNSELLSQREHYKAIKMRLNKSAFRPVIIPPAQPKVEVIQEIEPVSDNTEVKQYLTKRVGVLPSPEEAEANWLKHLLDPTYPVQVKRINTKPNLSDKAVFNQIVEKEQRTVVMMQTIIKSVCRKFGIKESELVSNRRTKRTVIARQYAMWLCREITHHSLPRIGLVFNRDHTTVLHGCNKIDAMIAAGKITRSGDLTREN